MTSLRIRAFGAPVPFLLSLGMLLFLLTVAPAAHAQRGITLASLAKRIARLENKLRYFTINANRRGPATLVIHNANVVVRGGTTTASRARQVSLGRARPTRSRLSAARRRALEQKALKLDREIAALDQAIPTASVTRRASRRRRLTIIAPSPVL